MIENVRNKNEKTTLYCGMMAVNGPDMFRSMDAALDNGAEGIVVFTVNSLRSPEVRVQFKAYTDSVRTARAGQKDKHPAVNMKTTHCTSRKCSYKVEAKGLK